MYLVAIIIHFDLVQQGIWIPRTDLLCQQTLETITLIPGTQLLTHDHIHMVHTFL